VCGKIRSSNQQCTAAQVPACPFSLVNERFLIVIFWNDFEQEMCGLHLMARNHDATIFFAVHFKYVGEFIVPAGYSFHFNC
jgi:hypothetical protein